MLCHMLGWHVFCPYCYIMANFLEGSFLKLLWLVFHILLFPWWFVWPHQCLVTNAYLLSWEVTFSLFKPAMCWPFVIWNLICFTKREKHSSRPSVKVLGEGFVFLFCKRLCHFESLFLFLPLKEDSEKEIFTILPLFICEQCLRNTWNTC